MKGKLLALTILSTLAFSAQAKMSCKILMDGFNADKKETIYDLTDLEKEKYNKCVDSMNLLPNSFKAFEQRTEAEANKRNLDFKKKERAKKDRAEREKIAQTRQLYTFTASELEEIFNKPVFAYRLKEHMRFEKLEGNLPKFRESQPLWELEKLTDINELCKAIGKEYSDKDNKLELHAVNGKLDYRDGKLERDKLNETGVYIPDSFWTSYDLFETDKKTRDKIKKDGFRRLKIMEFTEVTCVANDNKKDDFEDIKAEIIITNGDKEVSNRAEEDDFEVMVSEMITGESSPRAADETFDEFDEDFNDSPRFETEADEWKPNLSGDCIPGIDCPIDGTVER